MSRRLGYPAFVSAITLFCAATALPDVSAAPRPAPVTAPPSDYNYARIVRLSLVEGEVKINRPEEEGWPAALINMPIRQGYALASDRGRAEIEFESGATVRMAEDTVIEFTELALDDGNRITRITLNRGTATFYAKLGRRDVFAVITRHMQLSIPDDARFRVDVDPGGASVSVFKGDVQADSPGGTMRLTKGQTLLYRAAEADRVTLARNSEPDAWDRWVADRDEVLHSSRSATSRYLDHPYGYGVADLYHYGSWRRSRQYGYVWQPYGINAGWSPYFHGRWVYVNGAGWTWLSYEPWGWAPYHHGSWALTTFGWAWIPGVYSPWHPGLVVWLNFGNNIGWCPLGPRDRWGTGTAVFQNANNVTIINTTNGVATGQPNQMATGRKPLDPQGFSERPPVIPRGDIAGRGEPLKPGGASGATGADPGTRGGANAGAAANAGAEPRQPVLRPRGDLIDRDQPLKGGGRSNNSGTPAGGQPVAGASGASSDKEPARREPTEDVREERSGSMGRDPVRSGPAGRAPANHPDIVYDPRGQRYVNSDPSAPRRNVDEAERSGADRGRGETRGFQSNEPRTRPPRENESGAVYDPATGRYVNNPAVAPRTDADGDRGMRSDTSGGREGATSRSGYAGSAGAPGPAREAPSRSPDTERTATTPARPAYQDRSEGWGRPSSSAPSSGGTRHESRPSSPPAGSGSGSAGRGDSGSRGSSSSGASAPRSSSPSPAPAPRSSAPGPAARPSHKPGGGQ